MKPRPAFVPNGTARIHTFKAWGSKFDKKEEVPARITAKRIKTVHRVFERETGKEVRVHDGIGWYQCYALSWRIGDGATNPTEAGLREVAARRAK